ncbi:hypothetical protein GCM10019060_40710 [Novosphingobium pokkalii]|nr:hypothetical protein GCM10019060_40710 [Novosphingobium pokkalii]
MLWRLTLAQFDPRAIAHRVEMLKTQQIAGRRPDTVGPTPHDDKPEIPMIGVARDDGQGFAVAGFPRLVRDLVAKTMAARQCEGIDVEPAEGNLDHVT